jgi:hypothetical protein
VWRVQRTLRRNRRQALKERAQSTAHRSRETSQQGRVLYPPLSWLLRRSVSRGPHSSSAALLASESVTQ